MLNLEIHWENVQLFRLAMWPMELLLVHLSWNLTWAFPITFSWAFFCLSFQLSECKLLIFSTFSIGPISTKRHRALFQIYENEGPHTLSREEIIKNDWNALGLFFFKLLKNQVAKKDLTYRITGFLRPANFY